MPLLDNRPLEFVKPSTRRTDHLLFQLDDLDSSRKICTIWFYFAGWELHDLATVTVSTVSGLDLYSLYLDPARHLIPANAGSTVGDLYDLYDIL